MSLTDERYDSRNSSRGPRSRICFFRKKQMSLTDDRYESRNNTRGPQESNLLFLEKANVTHR